MFNARILQLFALVYANAPCMQCKGLDNHDLCECDEETQCQPLLSCTDDIMMHFLHLYIAFSNVLK